MDEKTPKKNKGLMRLVRACGYSYDGFVCAFKNEAAFRQELFVCAPLAVAAFALEFPLMTRCVLLLSMLGLLAVELLNSAIEECVNLASPQLHPLAKRAKDMASAAVFLALLWVAAAWAFALYGLLA